jgi:hypothetical protein
MNQRHLTDDQLTGVCLEGLASASQEDHLLTCAACQHRRESLSALLTEIADAADDGVDAAFPPERLARQRARILHRLEQDGRPGRVIAFPAGHPQGPSLLRPRQTTRWVAAVAAAAFFIIGLLAGHLAHDVPGQRTARVPQAASAATATGTTLRTASVPVSDEEFLYEVEAAVGSGGPAMLRRIDALTPRAWETR